MRVKNGKFLLGVAAVLACQLLLVGDVQAQTTGTIYGTVTDPTGAALPGATVTVENVETKVSRTATTDAQGGYLFPLLPVGQYDLTGQAAGFKAYQQKGIELQVQAHVRVDIELKLGEVTEEVVVTGQTPLVDTASTTLGKVVEGKRIVDLPLNGRNFLQLGVLQAGVTPPIPGVDVVGSGTNNTPGGTAVNFSVNGMRITSNNHLLDGVNNVEPVTGSAMVVPSPDALQEFRILTNMYSAEFGRAGGSIVTVVTKNGTNDFHGSVYEFVRNDVFDARNFFTEEVPKLRRNQFGFTFGGPIEENKTFFFGSYEGLRERRGIPVRATVPPLAQRQGDFSAFNPAPVSCFDPGAICDFTTFTPFPGNIIPSGRIDAVAREFLNLWPLPNEGTNIFTGAPTGSNDRNQFMVRLDHTLIEGKNTLTGRYLFDEGSLLIPVGHFASNAAPSVQVPGFPNEDANRFQNLMIADTHLFSQKLINDFRFSYQRARVAGGESVDPVDPASLGLTYPIASSIRIPPTIGVSGVDGLGPALLSQRVNNFYQFTDTVAVSAGKHNMKFGVDIRRTGLATLFPSLSHGAFAFVGVTGHPVADLLLGTPLFFLQAGGKEDKTLRQTAYYFFIQDDFRVSKNLTLNLGLRYELIPGFTERDNLLLTFVPGQQSVLSPTLPLGVVHSGDPGVPRTLFPTHKTNFGPRFGLAWDPWGDGKTSLRAGYGIFYDESSLIQTYNVFQAPDFQPIVFLLFPTVFGGTGTMADPFGGTSPFTPPLQFPIPVTGRTTATWIAADLKLPYIQHWNLTAQRQLTSSLAVEVAYVGNKATRLQGSIEINQPVWNPGASLFDIDARRPIAGLSGAHQVSSMFSSNYHGLQTTVTQRPTHGLLFQASYTWSKAIDFTTAPSAFFIIPGQTPGRAQDNRNLRAERGLSAFDLRHRFVLSYIYELPFFKGSTGAASYLLEGWRLSGIVTLQSGHPFTVVDTSDPGLDGVTDNDRTDLVGDPTSGSCPNGFPVGTPECWFNTTAFQPFVMPNFGNAGRNIVETDGIVNFDFGLAKQFNFDESRRLEFRWEVFNLFNHPNFGVPVNDIRSANFGRLFKTSTSERVMQFALKFIF